MGFSFLVNQGSVSVEFNYEHKVYLYNNYETAQDIQILRNYQTIDFYE